MKPDMANEHFTKISDAIIEDDKVSKEGLLVYVGIARFVGKERTAFPSLKKLSVICRIGRTSVQRGIQNLIECGYLSKESRGKEGKRAHVSNLYRLHENFKRMPRVGNLNERMPTGNNQDAQGGQPRMPKGNHEVDTVEVDTKKKREREQGQSETTPTGEVTPSSLSQLIDFMITTANSIGKPLSVSKRDEADLAVALKALPAEQIFIAWKTWLYNDGKVNVRFFLQDADIQGCTEDDMAEEIPWPRRYRVAEEIPY